MPVPIIVPIIAETGVAEVRLGKVPTGEMGGARSRSYPANVSRCESAACISHASGVSSEMMRAEIAMRKSVPATTKASPGGTESASPQVHAADMSHAAQAGASEVHATQMPETHTAKTHASQVHTTRMHSPKMHAPEVHTAEVHAAEVHAAEASHMHPAEASSAEMHPATTEVPTPTKSSEPSRLCVGCDAKGQGRRNQNST
jgi:hypothetical protein